MNRNERVVNFAINSTNQIELKKGQKVKSVAITCMNSSANILLIGWNDVPSTIDRLSQGESYGVTPDSGNYLDGNIIRFEFDTTNPTNTGTINEALVKIKYEQDEEVC